jgi:hypothetical protein
MRFWYLVQVYSESVFDDLFQELRMIFLCETNLVILKIVFLTTYPELRCI